MATTFNPLRRTDRIVFPDYRLHKSIQPYFDKISPYFSRVRRYAPLIAMTPLSNVYHIGIASLSLTDAAYKKEYGKAMLLTAYIGGLVLAPIPTIIASQGIILLKSAHNLQNLEISAIATSMLAIASKSPQARVVALFFNMIHYLNVARSHSTAENPDYEKAAIFTVCAGFCAADLYVHRDDFYSAIKLIADKANGLFSKLITPNNSNGKVQIGPKTFEWSPEIQYYVDTNKDFSSAMMNKNWSEAESILPKLLEIYSKHPEFLPELMVPNHESQATQFLEKLADEGADSSFINAFSDYISSLTQLVEKNGHL